MFIVTLIGGEVWAIEVKVYFLQTLSQLIYQPSQKIKACLIFYQTLIQHLVDAGPAS